MSFSQESKIAVRKALLRGLHPIGAGTETMQRLYNNILGAAGHDRRGEWVGLIAQQLIICYNINEFDEDPAGGDCHAATFFINGKMFQFTAVDTHPPEQDDGTVIHWDRFGFTVTLATASFNSNVVDRSFHTGQVQLDTVQVDGETVHRVNELAKRLALRKLALNAAEFLYNGMLNHWHCPSCAAMLIPDWATIILTTFGPVAARHCHQCARYQWEEPCTKCGSVTGMRCPEHRRCDRELLANTDLSRCLSCSGGRKA